MEGQCAQTCRSDQSSLAGVRGYHGPEQAAKMTALAHPAPQFLFLHAQITRG